MLFCSLSLLIPISAKQREEKEGKKKAREFVDQQQMHYLFLFIS